MLRVVTAGHVNWDVTLRVDAMPAPDGETQIRERVAGGGGSAANVAAALADLGVDAGVVGSVGDDERGRDARAELDAAGVDVDQVRVVSGGRTCVKYLVVDGSGEVMVLGEPGDNEAVDPSDVDRAYVAAADHLHLTSQRPETAAQFARVADDVGTTVSVDPGRRLDSRDYAAALAAADLVFLNDREAAALEETVPDGAVVVVKRGADGALVDAPAGRYRQQGFPVATSDTTGAGDAFAAGFLACALRDGGLEEADWERALARGNACGALAARTAGARTPLDPADVEDVLAREQ